MGQIKLVLTNEQLEVAKSKYKETTSLAKTSKFIGISATSLYKIFKENKIETPKQINNGEKIRKYALDHNYFENIDTRDKAYITGLLHADGFINLKSRQTRLKLTDLDLVKEVSSKIFKDRKLYLDSSSTKNGHKANLSLVITSQKIMNDCIKHGCVHQKTYNLEFPTTIPDELMCDYFRGFFDGDGCIYVNEGFSYRPGTMKIVATKKWVDKAKEFLHNKGIKSTIYGDKRHDNRVSDISVITTDDLVRFYNYLYKDIENQIYLKRKYLKYTDWVDFKKSANYERYNNL